MDRSDGHPAKRAPAERHAVAALRQDGQCGIARQVAQAEDLAVERPLDTEFVGAAATSPSANEIEGGELRCVRSVYFQK